MLKAVKAVKFTFKANAEVRHLLETFRQMCNDAICLALTERPKSRFDLIELSYRRLKEYGLHSHYILSACEVAYSVYKNKNRKSDPYVKKSFLKLDNQSYRLDYLLLRIPIKPRNYIYITLSGSLYHRSFLADRSLERGSVTITENAIVISFSKEVSEIEPQGYIGVDVNERNLTIAATNGYIKQFNGLGEVAEIKERYKAIRAKIGRITRQDRRISRNLYAKYGKRERNRTTQRIHRVSREIAEYARENRFGIKLEKLKGIRKLYHKRNGQGRSYRGRMNSWVFYKTQRQVDYKARWDGIPTLYVNPRGTSSNCPDCGSRVVAMADRKLYCPRCDKTWDRDVLGAQNVMAAVVPAARPLRGSNERELRRQEDAGNPQSRWAEVRLRGHVHNLNNEGLGACALSLR